MQNSVRCFILVSCLVHSSILNMEAAGSSETSVNINRITRCHIPEYSILAGNFHFCLTMAVLRSQCWKGNCLNFAKWRLARQMKYAQREPVTGRLGVYIRNPVNWMASDLVWMQWGSQEKNLSSRFWPEQVCCYIVISVKQLDL